MYGNDTLIALCLGLGAPHMNIDDYASLQEAYQS